MRLFGRPKGDATFLSRESERASTPKGAEAFLPPQKRIVYLYGAPASGKTTLGRRLAQALDCDFIDLDAAIVHTSGSPIAKIFETKGEARFRALESSELRLVGNFRASKGTPVVIALGGGTLLSDENRAFCEKTGTVICLETPSEEELARRLKSAAGSRPLGNRAKERAAHYASFPNRLAAWFDLGNSLVLVGQGLAPAVVAGRNVVADETVFGRHPGLFGQDRTAAVPSGSRVRLVASIPSGESHKTISTVASLWSAFARAGLGRKDAVIAVGGGVTGDLTGFAAATFMRGIDWINVPTTLLAMTDASTGGKTGCDLAEGKNLAGAFHTPKLVVIDTDFLKTLPSEILRAGKAEMIKHALVGGRKTYPFGSAKGAVPTPAEIAANLAVKVEIVRKDPFEKTGERLKLNCGHTIAHAIEKLSDYKVSHGDAVAIGCVEEARMAAKRGLSPAKWPDEVAKAFADEGLPTGLPKGIDWAKMVPVMRGDKKRAGSVVAFALPCGWGDVRAVPIDFEKDAL